VDGSTVGRDPVQVSKEIVTSVNLSFRRYKAAHDRSSEIVPKSSIQYLGGGKDIDYLRRISRGS